MKVICFNCNKLFNKPKSQMSLSGANYCSKSCAAKINNKKFPKRKKKKKYLCKTCKIDLPYRRSYCDIHHPQNINWDKVTIGNVRGSRRYQKHSRIRALARKNYLKSNNIKCCKICGYKLHFQVCHIKPIYEFSNEDFVGKVNKLSNLIALCPNHHWELDHGFLNVDNY